MMVDVSQIKMETTILGDKIDFPICIAPTASQRMAHPDGEIANAKGQLVRNLFITLIQVSRKVCGADCALPQLSFTCCEHEIT